MLGIRKGNLGPGRSYVNKLGREQCEVIRESHLGPRTKSGEGAKLVGGGAGSRSNWAPTCVGEALVFWRCPENCFPD